MSILKNVPRPSMAMNDWERPALIYWGEMKTFSNEERAAIARGWAASGLPQDQYAAKYGVTSRALRGW